MESSEAKFGVSFDKIESKNGTRAGFKILFWRKYEFHLMSMYLPSMIFVIISWIRYNITIIRKSMFKWLFESSYLVFWYLQKHILAEFHFYSLHFWLWLIFLWVLWKVHPFQDKSTKYNFGYFPVLVLYFGLLLNMLLS